MSLRKQHEIRGFLRLPCILISLFSSFPLSWGFFTKNSTNISACQVLPVVTHLGVLSVTFSGFFSWPPFGGSVRVTWKKLVLILFRHIKPERIRFESSRYHGCYAFKSSRCPWWRRWTAPANTALQGWEWCQIGLNYCVNRKENVDTVYIFKWISYQFYRALVGSFMILSRTHSVTHQSNEEHNRYYKNKINTSMKVPSLKLTAKAPENGWLEYLFPFGSFWYCFFQGASVSFMEGNSLEYAKASITNNTWNLF